VTTTKKRDQITYVEFIVKFNDKYFLESIRTQKNIEFPGLRRGLVSLSSTIKVQLFIIVFYE